MTDESLVAFPRAAQSDFYGKGVVNEQIARGVKPKVERVPLDKLRATQLELNAPPDEEFGPDPDEPEKGVVFERYADKPIVLKKNDGTYMVLDGHNRLSAAVRSGKPSDAYVFNESNTSDDLRNKLDADDPGYLDDQLQKMQHEALAPTPAQQSVQRAVLAKQAAPKTKRETAKPAASKWVPHRSAVPGSVKGTNEATLPLSDRKALREKVKNQVAEAVQSKLPTNMAMKVKAYNNGADINIGVHLKDDPASSAWARIGVDDSGNVFVQQHDTSIDQKHRGKGYGGQMIDALIAGYKALGAAKGDVPIHVNSNPSFWDHMSKKHGGIFDEE